MENYTTPEGGNEKISSYEEVMKVMKEILGEANFKETRKKEDEKGLYLLEVEVVNGDETTELGYTRKGRYPECESGEDSIHTTYYVDGVPVGGEVSAKIKDGEWIIL